MEHDENMEKYYNYNMNLKKIDRAIETKSYFEAISIAYTFIEDRTISLLKTHKPEDKEKFLEMFLGSKLNMIKSVVEKDEALRHYLTDEFIEDIFAWSKRRNNLMHNNLLNSRVKDSDLKEIAEDGIAIVNKLISISQGYKLAKEKEKGTDYFLQIKKGPALKDYRQIKIANNDRITLMVSDNVGKKKLFEIKRVDDEIFMTNLTDEEIPTRAMDEELVKE